MSEHYQQGREIGEMDRRISPEDLAKFAGQPGFEAQVAPEDFGPHPEHNDPETAAFITKGRLALAAAAATTFIAGVVVARKFRDK